MIVDSHCHLYDKKLNELRDDILKNLQKDNQIAICNGDNIETSELSILLANQNKNVYATVGIHPHEAKNFNDNSIKELKLLLNSPKIVAIGEIGLDYYYNFTEKSEQINALSKQIILASEVNLPCVFHVRDATKDFLNLIKELYKKYKIKGYIHSFSGSIETAKIYLKYNFYIGINGIITFKNANKMLDVVKFIPLENILIETDSPYLTPVPYRGAPNRPEYVELVAKKIAEIKNIDIEKVKEITTQNAKKFFSIK